ncbi:M14 family zinc carboxypeptidase [Zunongwangia endophytica]|uniref:M14 family zinc carboxypeptidase n=1 Tax=Zunongwangia endophytica TaxID=1808945 RepID=A0ABV8HCJ6_9FLAO|nr:M14 family zinc carboxypeptidase [Zunongwangia endophytica]MDN3594022.1 M14 family zinc carboxypeptidase [Zunongwangia endophytica]
MKKYAATIGSIVNLYEDFKLKEIQGRYINQSHIQPILNKFEEHVEISKIGFSVNKEPIHLLKIGSGKTNVLAWSQMHGNESTTTKAILDVFNALISKDSADLKLILDNITLYCIPMLNPDGSRKYTRFNYNNVDLNRDAQHLTQPESRILRKIFEEIKPDFCLNLHGQRTIFSAGLTNKSAVMSFLTPAEDHERNITPKRLESMKVIAQIAEDLKTVLPEQIGRYDDGFNLNCTGDTFQSEGVPTILFEEGHFPNDYTRETTREFAVASIFSSLRSIATKSYLNFSGEDYFKIPENGKKFNDILIKNVRIKNGIFDVSIQYSEKLEGEKVEFIPKIENISAKIDKYGHREIDGNGKILELEGEKSLVENVVVDKILLNKEILMVKCD